MKEDCQNVCTGTAIHAVTTGPHVDLLSPIVSSTDCREYITWNELFQPRIHKALDPSLPHSESHPIDSHFGPCVVISIGGMSWRIGVTHLLKRQYVPAPPSWRHLRESGSMKCIALEEWGGVRKREMVDASEAKSHGLSFSDDSISFTWNPWSHPIGAKT